MVVNPANRSVPERKLGRPADSDSTDTRERILRNACERFAAEGFEGTTNKDIAEKAQVSSAALYHYFPSKADMYIAVCDSITESFSTVFQKVADCSPTLEGRMTALFAEVGRLGDESPEIVGFITGISAVLRKHPEVSRGADAFGAHFRRLIMDIISTATESEKILTGISVSGLADLTASVLAGLGRMSSRGDQERHVAAGQAYLHLIRAAAHN